MFSSSLLFLALVPAVTFGLVACANEPGADATEDIAEVSAASIAPNQALIGTFQKGRTEVGSLDEIVFKTDGTYHRAVPEPCSNRWCVPKEDNGRYVLWSENRIQMISLYPDGGAPVRYQYVINDDRLRIAPSGDHVQWTVLWKTESEAWCDAPADCELQNLPVGICGGQWYCISNMCSYPCHQPGAPE